MEENRPQAKSYSPAHYTSDQRDIAQDLMKRFELATLISQSEKSLQISHLPLVLSQYDGKECFLGHMAKANPHWRMIEENAHATVIFKGPDHYISPAWYEPQEDNVPTWNYAAVHIEAKVELVNEPNEALQLLEEQVDWWETNLGTNWKLDIDNPSIRDLGKAIVAFRIFPLAHQLKFKLSQKQSVHDWESVVANLKSLPSDSAKQVADLMKETRK